jgi:hypothetical protein
LSKIFKVIVAVIVVVVAFAILGPVAANLGAQLFNPVTLAAMKAGAIIGGVMGFGMTIVQGGSFQDALLGGLKGAFWGAISAGVAQGIGTWMGHSVSFFTEGSFGPALAKATAHGLSRGVITAAQGGKFGAGFASGFVSSGFAVGKDTFESLKGAAVAARTAVMAVVGGMTSQFTGGKFANGAITGAFVHLFNNEEFSKAEINKYNDAIMRKEQSLAIVQENGDKLVQNLQTETTNGIKTINSYSSVAGPALTLAGAAEGDFMTYGLSLFLDGVAVTTEGILILLGEQNGKVSTANGINGALIDVIVPSGKSGTVVGTVVKDVTKVD